jgi:hypothetical protein
MILSFLEFPALMLFSFMLAGPVLFVVVLIFALRKPTRRLGVSMLISGVAGYVCTVSAIALRIRVYSQFKGYGYPANWIANSVIVGLAGFTAFVIFAAVIYHSRRGLTNR